MAGKMQNVSSDMNNREKRPENNSDGTNNKGRLFSVGNQGRCAKKNKSKVYSKKRRYHGPKKKKVDDDNNNSTTHKKVVDVNMVDDAAEKNKVEGYRLVDMDIFAELVMDLLCPVCCDSQVTSVLILQKEGFIIFFRSEFSSPTIKKSGKGLNAYVNTRSVYAMKLWTGV